MQKKDSDKIRSRMMVKTTPDSVDAQKPASEILFWQNVPHYPSSLPHMKQGMSPFSSDTMMFLLNMISESGGFDTKIILSGSNERLAF